MSPLEAFFSSYPHVEDLHRNCTKWHRDTWYSSTTMIEQVTCSRALSKELSWDSTLSQIYHWSYPSWVGDCCRCRCPNPGGTLKSFLLKIYTIIIDTNITLYRGLLSKVFLKTNEVFLHADSWYIFQLVWTVKLTLSIITGVPQMWGKIEIAKTDKTFKVTSYILGAGDPNLWNILPTVFLHALKSLNSNHVNQK